MTNITKRHSQTDNKRPFGLIPRVYFKIYHVKYTVCMYWMTVIVIIHAKKISRVDYI